jgi:hypothetical protein
MGGTGDLTGGRRSVASDRCVRRATRVTSTRPGQTHNKRIAARQVEMPPRVAAGNATPGLDIVVRCNKKRVLPETGRYPIALLKSLIAAERSIRRSSARFGTENGVREGAC